MLPRSWRHWLYARGDHANEPDAAVVPSVAFAMRRWRATRCVIGVIRRARTAAAPWFCCGSTTRAGRRAAESWSRQQGRLGHRPWLIGGGG